MPEEGAHHLLPLFPGRLHQDLSFSEDIRTERASVYDFFKSRFVFHELVTKLIKV